MTDADEKTLKWKPHGGEVREAALPSEEKIKELFQWLDQQVTSTYKGRPDGAADEIMEGQDAGIGQLNESKINKLMQVAGEDPRACLAAGVYENLCKRLGMDLTTGFDLASFSKLVEMGVFGDLDNAYPKVAAKINEDKIKNP